MHLISKILLFLLAGIGLVFYWFIGNWGGLLDRLISYPPQVSTNILIGVILKLLLVVGILTVSKFLFRFLIPRSWQLWLEKISVLKERDEEVKEQLRKQEEQTK